MTRFSLIFVLILTFSLATRSVRAQKICYIETDYILGQVPEYISAQKQLDATAELWQKEIDGKQREIEKMKKALQADWVLLTDELRMKRETEIGNQVNALEELQKKRFGVDGELFVERKKLMKPIQEKIAMAIRTVAEDDEIDILIDKSSADGLLLYGLPKYDKSDDVLKKMGYKPPKDDKK